MIRQDMGPGRNGNFVRDPARPALTEPQWAIYEAGWDQTVRFRVAVCGRRFGKALALSTPLPSPDGWTTMGALQQGDRLFDERGRVCKVVFATEVMLGRPCRELHFDDGMRVIADDDHLWQVYQQSQTLILKTSELAQRLVEGTASACWFANCRAVELAVCEWREDPYRIGLLAIRRGSLAEAEEGLCGSVQQRRRLLQGIIEGNGGYRLDGQYSLVCPRGDLQRGLLTLLRSLGYSPSITGCKIAWSRERSAARRRIVAIERVSSVAVRCIQVNSASKLYLCGEGFLPTHNTFLMAEEIRRAARLAIRANVGVENEIWYGAPTFTQAKRVMWGRLKRTIPQHWLDGRANETNCSMRLRSGHVIRIVGLDAFENLRGSGLWFFGGDEWADCRPEAWSEVLRPMLSTSRGHALFIGTPKGFDHFRDAFLLGQPGGDPSYRSFLFTTIDGGNVPADEIVAAQQQLDPRTFRQEYGASFESYAGRVVYAFSRAESVRQSRYDIGRPLHVGMDFNINPMSATVWQEDGEMTRQIAEIILPTSNTDEMAAEITRRYGRSGFDPMKKSVDHITIYPDPAGAQRRSSAAGRTDIGILREAGFRVVAMLSHPTVRDRTNVMNRRFLSADGTRCAFVDPSCVKSIEAYERLVYRDGSNEPDKTLGYDHLVDASGYYLFAQTQRGLASITETSHIMER